MFTRVNNAREAGGHGKGFFCWFQDRTLDIIVQFGYEWTRSEQQMEVVGWTDVRATIHVREIDVQRQDKFWQVHDSAPHLWRATWRRTKLSLTREGLSSPESSVTRPCWRWTGTSMSAKSWLEPGGGAEADSGHYAACECWCQEAWRKGKHPE